MSVRVCVSRASQSHIDRSLNSASLFLSLFPSLTLSLSHSTSLPLSLYLSPSLPLWMRLKKGTCRVADMDEGTASIASHSSAAEFSFLSRPVSLKQHDQLPAICIDYDRRTTKSKKDNQEQEHKQTRRLVELKTRKVCAEDLSVP